MSQSVQEAHGALVDFLAPILRSRGFDTAVLATLSIEVLGLLMFSIFPYTFKPKEWLLRKMKTGRTLPLLRSLYAYPVLAAVAAASAVLEAQAIRLMPDSNRTEDQDKSSATEGRNSGRKPPSIDRLHRSLALLLLTAFTSRVTHRVEDGDIEDLVALDKTVEERQIIKFRPPPLIILQTVTRFYRSFFAPVFLGRENLPIGKGKPKKPVLFVSNHTILGFDFPLLLSWLYEKEGIFLRVLADHSHFQIPGNADVMRGMLARWTTIAKILIPK